MLDYFTDLVVATLTDEKTQLEELRGQTITLARNAKQPAKWDVFTGGMDGYPRDAMILLDNLFRIQDVLLSTAENQVKLQVDGQVYRLRPGEVLFVLD